MKRLKQYYRSILFAFLAVGISLPACIEVLDTPLDINAILIINAQFTNSDSLRTMEVATVNNITGDRVPIAASASIYKDGTLSTDLLPLSTGILALPQGYLLEEGAEYFAEIILANGQVYRSSPQIIFPRIKTDSISFEVIENFQQERVQGDPIIQRGIEFFVHTDLPNPDTTQQYYRWVVDEVWSFIGVGGNNTCYVRESIYENSFAVLSNVGIGTRPGEVRVSILKQALDFSFEHTHYVNAYLHSIDAKTYDFYNKTERILNAGGTIYDEVPGRIESNITNQETPEERIGGWVEFFLPDTFRFKIRGSQIPVPVPLQCDPPPGVQPSGRCLSCAGFYGQDSRTPPDYWED